jgi:hypothetical protein
MILIKPIKLGLPAKTATQFWMRPIFQDTQATTCQLYYEVQAETGEQLANGNIELTEDQYAEWGDDNAFIEDIALTNLGLERA